MPLICKMNILSVMGIALVSIVLITVLKQYRPEFAVPVEICAAVILIFLILSPFTEILNSVNRLIQLSGIDPAYFKLLVKAIGIVIIVQLAADTCRDSGSSALAHKVELAGRVAVILTVLPMVATVAEFAMGLIKG